MLQELLVVVGSNGFKLLDLVLGHCVVKNGYEGVAKLAIDALVAHCQCCNEKRECVFLASREQHCPAVWDS